MSTVISVRVRKEVKEILEREGIDIAKEVKDYLESLAWRTQAKKSVEKWRTILNNVKPSEKSFSAKSVREDRESH